MGSEELVHTFGKICTVLLGGGVYHFFRVASPVLATSKRFTGVGIFK